MGNRRMPSQGGRIKSLPSYGAVQSYSKRCQKTSQFCPENRLEQPGAFSYSDFPKERGKTQPFWVISESENTDNPLFQNKHLSQFRNGWILVRFRMNGSCFLELEMQFALCNKGWIRSLYVFRQLLPCLAVGWEGGQCLLLGLWSLLIALLSVPEAGQKWMGWGLGKSWSQMNAKARPTGSMTNTTHHRRHPC